MPPSSLSSFHIDTFDWLKMNLTSSDLCHNSKIPWTTLFSFAVWNIWLHRNRLIFDSKQPVVSDLIYATISKATEYWAIVGQQAKTGTKSTVEVKWNPPPRGWFKLNTDGAARGNPGMAGSAAIVRNENGEWIIGCSRGLGICSNFVAELQGLRDGLLLVQNRSLLPIFIELDALSVIQAITNDNTVVPSSVGSLVDDCRRLLKGLQHHFVRHIYREANSVADFVAKKAVNTVNSFMIFETPPPGVGLYLDSDSRGVAVNRLVNYI